MRGTSYGTGTQSLGQGFIAPQLDRSRMKAVCVLYCETLKNLKKDIIAWHIFCFSQAVILSLTAVLLDMISCVGKAKTLNGQLKSFQAYCTYLDSYSGLNCPLQAVLT